MRNKSIHIKGLDGIRALAALILLWSHLAQECFATWFANGGGKISSWLPVCCAYVFFVLSGFLAGFKPSSNISLSKYYKKKAKRILPLYYFYIIFAIVVFMLMGRGDEVINSSLWFYIIPLPNIPFSGFGNAILPLAHLWFIGSLLVFYLIFPLVERWSGDKLLKTSAIIAIAWALAKWAIYLFIGKGTFVYKFWGTLGVDCMFLGVVLGILVKNGNKLISNISESSVISILAWLLFLTSGIYDNFIPSACRVEYMAVITCFLILSQLPMKPIVNLDNKVCDWLGGISYEIYVMQILVIILLSNLYTALGLSLPTIAIYAIVTAVVILVAWGVNRFVKLIFN